MDGFVPSGERGFLDRFVQRRVGMTGATDIFRRRGEFNGERQLGDQGAGIRPDNMRAQYPVGLGIGQNFDEAGAIGTGGPRPRIGDKRELADTVLNAIVLELFLGPADRGWSTRPFWTARWSGGSRTPGLRSWPSLPS